MISSVRASTATSSTGPRATCACTGPPPACSRPRPNSARSTATAARQPRRRDRARPTPPPPTSRTHHDRRGSRRPDYVTIHPDRRHHEFPQQRGNLHARRDCACSESSPSKPGAVAIDHIQACAGWARHDCFGSPGCSRPHNAFAHGSDGRVDCVVVTVGDHRTVCSPQPAAADRRPPARGAAPPPPDESRTAGDADLALLLLARLRSRARRRCPTPRRSAEVCESYDPRVSTQARAVAARRFLMVAGPGT